MDYIKIHMGDILYYIRREVLENTRFDAYSDLRYMYIADYAIDTVKNTIVKNRHGGVEDIIDGFLKLERAPAKGSKEINPEHKIANNLRNLAIELMESSFGSRNRIGSDIRDFYFTWLEDRGVLTPYSFCQNLKRKIMKGSNDDILFKLNSCIYSEYPRV